MQSDGQVEAISQSFSIKARTVSLPVLAFMPVSPHPLKDNSFGHVTPLDLNQDPVVDLTFAQPTQRAPSETDLGEFFSEMYL